jgi:hypothetical protein
MELSDLFYIADTLDIEQPTEGEGQQDQDQVLAARNSGSDTEWGHNPGGTSSMMEEGTGFVNGPNVVDDPELDPQSEHPGSHGDFGS